MGELHLELVRFRQAEVGIGQGAREQGLRSLGEFVHALP